MKVGGSQKHKNLKKVSSYKAIRFKDHICQCE